MKPNLMINLYYDFCNRSEIGYFAGNAILLAALTNSTHEIGIFVHRNAPGFELRVIHPNVIPRRIILPTSTRLPCRTMLRAFLEQSASNVDATLYPDAPFVVTTHIDHVPNVMPLEQAFGVKPDSKYDGEQYVTTKFRL